MSELLSLKDAMDIYQIQYSHVDQLWNYFSATTLAVLGYTIGSDKATRSMQGAYVIILGYFVFCIGNLAALFHSQLQLVQFANIVINSSTINSVTNPVAIKSEELKKIDLTTLVPWSPLCIGIFYCGVVAVVCFAIYYVTRKRQQEAGDSK